MCCESKTIIMADHSAALAFDFLEVITLLTSSTTISAWLHEIKHKKNVFKMVLDNRIRPGNASTRCTSVVSSYKVPSPSY